MRDQGEELAFAPRLPARLTRLSFRLVYRRRRLRVTVHPAAATYELLDGEPVVLLHRGERLTLTAGAPETRELPPAPQHPAPEQPPGRTPPLGARPRQDHV